MEFLQSAGKYMNFKKIIKSKKCLKQIIRPIYSVTWKLEQIAEY